MDKGMESGSGEKSGQGVACAKTLRRAEALGLQGWQGWW